jgi:hypothetical protein
MRPSLIHRIFASIFGLWVAFFLRRDSLADFNWPYATILLTLVAFIIFCLQASILIKDGKKRFRYILPMMFVCALSIGAIYALELFYYGAKAVPTSVVSFLGSIVLVWVVSNEVGYRLYDDEEWNKE